MLTGGKTLSLMSTARHIVTSDAHHVKSYLGWRAWWLPPSHGWQMFYRKATVRYEPAVEIVFRLVDGRRRVRFQQ